MIKRNLAEDGIMTVVLQIQDVTKSPVTKTQFISLQKLNDRMSLVSPEKFVQIATNAGFSKLQEEIITLESGKKFYTGIFKNIQ